MLRYIKKYRLISYVVIGVIALLLIVVLPLMAGTALMFPWNVLIAFIVFAAANLGVSYFMGKYVNSKAEAMVNLLNEQCDPKALIDQGETYAKQVMEGAPFERWGSWYLSTYTLALIDQEDRNTASTYVQAMNKSLVAAKNAEEKFEIGINLYEPLKELLGAQPAQECLNELKALTENNPTLQKHEGQKYLNYAQSLLVAEANPDKTDLIHLYHQVIGDEEAELFKRVQAADSLAKIYRQQEEVEPERACLNFIVESGNTMSCVSKAQIRLAQL